MDAVMVFDVAKTKNKKSTIWLGMRGRDAARKVDSLGGHFTGFHEQFLRDRIYRESKQSHHQFTIFSWWRSREFIPRSR